MAPMIGTPRTKQPNRIATLAALAFLLATPQAKAADIDRARQVVSMVYDIGLYESELDRAMAQADAHGVFGSRSGTPAGRAKDRLLTRASLMAQRDAVLRLASDNIATRATDPQLAELLRMAASPNASVDQHLIESAVTVVKAGFEAALWDQMARIARGNTEFPCTREQRSRCL